MSTLVRMAAKDLRRQVRQPLAALSMLAFPVIFASLLALTFGGGSGSGLPRVVVLVDDRDDSELSQLMTGMAASGKAGEFFDVRPLEPGHDWERAFRDGEASALLRIPEGFQDDLLLGRPLTLELVRNPAQGILPEVAEQALLVLADALDAGSRLFREPLDRVAASEGEPDVSEVSAAFAAVFEKAAPRLFPPPIAVETVERGGADGDDASGGGGAGGGGGESPLAAIFLLILPGVSVWALFLMGDLAMRDLLTEEKDGTLRRQLVGPLRPVEIVAGKALYAGALATLGLVILALIGWALTGRTADPVGFAALGLAVIVAVAGFSTVVYGLARTERQGATFSSAVLLAFAAFGGAFVPVDNLPGAVQRFAPLSPIHWAVGGFRALLDEGAGVGGILPQIGLLAGGGFVLLLAGSVLLERRLRRAPA